MGILNATPDSFSDGGDFKHQIHVDQFIQACEKYCVDIIDVGGESSRPGSDPVSETEEYERVIPIIKTIKSKTNIPISIDTMKARIADAAIINGASIINDISAAQYDDSMLEVAAKHGVPYIMMHMQGKPKTMQDNPVYQDVIQDILEFFKNRISVAKKKGVNSIIIDPGIGFGKTSEHNFQLTKALHKLTSLNKPILFGASRKRFLTNAYGLNPKDRDIETVSIHTLAVQNGARILRTHNVEFGRKMIEVCNQYLNC